MKLTVKRFADNGDTTMGAFYINGVFECFTIEDEQRKAKVNGETRVPEGVYQVSLRKEGGFHNKYTKAYPKMHKGMLCVHNAPDWKLVNQGMTFQYILIHTGNTDEHTNGCLLLNDAVSGATFVGSSSVDAYKGAYPKILSAIEKGESVSIEYIDVEEGK